MKSIRKWFDKIEQTIAVVVLFVVLLIMTWQVVARVFLNIPNSWSEELTRYLCFALVFFAASYAIKEEAHIRVDGLLKIYPEKLRMPVVILGYVCLFVYCVYVAAKGCTYTYYAWKMGQVAPSLGGVPMWIFYITLPISHFFMAFRTVEVVVRILKRGTYVVPDDGSEKLAV